MALGNFLALRGPSPGPLAPFCYADGRPLTRQQLSSTLQAWVTVSGLAWLRQLLHGESLITLSRLLTDSLVMRKMYVKYKSHKFMQTFIDFTSSKHSNFHVENRHSDVQEVK